MSKKKVFLFGARGMLGQAVREQFEQLFDLTGYAHAALDINDEPAVWKAVEEKNPEILINCAGYTNVDQCEASPEVAFQVNGLALKAVSQAARHVGAKLIHISTDYVFDGSDEAYDEIAVKNPLSVYGQSKSVGEDLLLETYPEGSYILRTAWLFGPGGKNFVNTMLDLAAKGEPVRAVTDQVGSPTYTVDLAAMIRLLIESDRPAGIYHVTNTGYCNWLEFATYIFQTYNPAQLITPVTWSDLKRPAQRPSRVILQNTKLPPLRPWQDALGDYLAKIQTA